MVTVSRTFSFNAIGDADILEALDAAGSRRQSALVRQALREFLDRKGKPVELGRDDIVEACRQAFRLELAGRMIQVPAGDSELIPATPESEAAQNLARLGDALEEW